MLERFPNSAVLYNIAGASNAGLMQLGPAINNYKQALQIKPDYAEVYRNIGDVLKDSNDLRGAIDSYKQALKIKPDFAEAYNNMGVALQDMGDLDAADSSVKYLIWLQICNVVSNSECSPNHAPIFFATHMVYCMSHKFFEASRSFLPFSPSYSHPAQYLTGCVYN